MSVNPVVKKDLLIGGAVLLSAILVGRFLHHTPTGTTIPSYPTGNMSLYGGNLSSPAGVSPTLGNYPTTPPTGTTPTPPVNTSPGIVPLQPPDEHRPNDPGGPIPPGVRPDPRPTGDGCVVMPNGYYYCPPETMPGNTNPLPGVR